MPRISLIFASLHVLLLLILVAPIVRRRISRKIGIGSGGDEFLSRSIRVQGNFIEYVPIALVMLLLLELSGLREVWLWAFGSTLLTARVLHAYGLSGSAGTSPGRALGALLTFAVILAMAVTGLAIGWRLAG
ncbi:MAG: MAPEG family protein [Lysobacter sp.]